VPEAGGDYKGSVTFFHCANASRSIRLSNGKRIAFDPYKYFAGSWSGIAAVEDQDTIDGLNELVLKPKSGITRITQEEYEACLKKKVRPPSYKPLPESRAPLSAAIQLLPAGNPAVVAGKDLAVKPDPEAVPAAVPRVFDSLDEVVKIGVVKTAEALPTPPKKDMGQRSARSTGRPSRRPKYRSDDVPQTEEAT